MVDLSAVRRARFAVAAVFLANGIVMGTWAAHIPLVEERLAISHSTLGHRAFRHGVRRAHGDAADRADGRPLRQRRRHARRDDGALRPPSCCRSSRRARRPLMAALFVFGATNGVDGRGDERTRRRRRAAAQAAGDVVLPRHVEPRRADRRRDRRAAAAVACRAFGEAGLTVVAGSWRSQSSRFSSCFRRAPTAVSQGTAFAWPSRATIGLGVLCFLSMTSEGAIIDWAALHLKGSLELGAGLAATGFAAYAAVDGDQPLLRRPAAQPLRRDGSGARQRAPRRGRARHRARRRPAAARHSPASRWSGSGLRTWCPVFFGAAGRHSGPVRRHQHRRRRDDRLFGLRRRPAFHRLRRRSDEPDARRSG